MPSTLSSDAESSPSLMAIFIIALIAVLTHWNVWENGVFSMGWNTSITWLALGVMLIRSNNALDLCKDWLWLVPLSLIALSFGLYENPWLKTICFVVMPIGVGIFFSFGHLNQKHEQMWGTRVVAKLVSNMFDVVSSVVPSLRLLRDTFFCEFDDSNLSVIKRIVRALLILLPLMFVVLLLLSSADDNFDLMVSGWFEFLSEFLDWSIAAKALCVFLLSGVLLAVVTTLRQNLEIENEHKHKARQVDDLIAVIVLASILLVYIAFLSLQLDYLMVDKLPIEFADTERLVKSGFWQLFFLSIINVGLFYWAYKHTGRLAQWILRLYLIASALILMSAGWRMGLYVFYYGLSYEKFFASYTTLYALALFGFLGWAVFCSARKDIVKTLCLSALWMFSLASVLPVERIIFSSNLMLSKNAESRIDLFHLSNLSIDVLGVALQNFDKGTIDNNEAWANWLNRTVAKNCARPWYESNLSLELNCSAASLVDLPSSNWRSYN